MLVFEMAFSCLADSRVSVITLEGEEETFTESLYVTGYGFSFWYADEWLDMPIDDEGVFIGDVNDDGYLELAVLAEDEAEEWIADHEGLLYAEGDSGADILYFQEPGEDELVNYEALVTYGSHAVRVFGWWPVEADEGTGEFFRRAVRSISFEQERLMYAEWAEDEDKEDDDDEDDDEYSDEGTAAVRLYVTEPVTDVQLLDVEWSELWTGDLPTCRLSARQSWESFEPGAELTVTVEFIGEMPNNGIAFTDASGAIHRYALDISGEDGSLYLWELDEYLAEE